MHQIIPPHHQPQAADSLEIESLRYPLNYLHNNPVKRRLVSSPDQWPWSNFRFHYLNDSAVLTMDRLA
jgi:hypothetical protein